MLLSLEELNVVDNMRAFEVYGVDSRRTLEVMGWTAGGRWRLSGGQQEDVGALEVCT